MRPLAPLLRGEGWGEGLFDPRPLNSSRHCAMPLTRNFRFARISTSPRKRAGRGELSRQPSRFNQTPLCSRFLIRSCPEIPGNSPITSTWPLAQPHTSRLTCSTALPKKCKCECELESSPMISLQQRIAALRSLVAQLRELDRLRERVRRAELSVRRSRRIRPKRRALH